jgi:hypothetical protein
MPPVLDSAVDAMIAETTATAPRHSRFEKLIAEYRRDHRNPVNHVLHVGVGWPIAAAAVITFPFRPLWGIGLLALAYAIMFFGHFVFERNIPTIFKHPTTPFVIAGNVIRAICGGVLRVVRPCREASRPVSQ